MFVLIVQILFSSIQCYTSGRNILYGLSSYRHIKLDGPENILKRVGITSHISSGFTTYLPYGQLLVDKLIQYVESKFIIQLGAAKAKFPNLVPHNMMLDSRKLEFGKSLFNVIDRYDRKYYLSPTSEEIVAQIVSQMGISPTLDKPIYMFQSNDKYRDEIRPCNSSMRYREFLMFDLYSFHNNINCLNKTFDKVVHIYKELFDEFGIVYDNVDLNYDVNNINELEFYTIMGNKRIELGHLFRLGTKYTEGLNNINSLYMASYGIGILRLLSAILFNNKDNEGVIIPKQLTPIDIVIMDPNCNSNIINKLLTKNNDCVILDDREGKIEDKLIDLRAIGVPRIIISNNNKSVRYWDRNESNFKEIEY